MSKLSTSQRAKVEAALQQHDKYSGCYFWNRVGPASTRRHLEGLNNWSVKFRHAGRVYEYESNVSISCANTYYRGTFTVDGEKRTVRLFKQLLA